MKKRKSEKGFTIIELVVVILLLGILTATALPRFMDITSEAHDAVVQGVLGGLNTGVALSRATWFAQGRSGAITGIGNNQTINVNTMGYPTNVTNGNPAAATDCATVYTQLLQEGGRPTIIASTAGALSTWPTPAAITNSYSTDFVAAVSVPVCFYIYTGEGQNVSSPVMAYDTSTGVVTLSSGEI